MHGITVIAGDIWSRLPLSDRGLRNIQKSDKQKYT
jgi:hypothetical protein